MSLRRSPQLTPAALAARRANALKSTGPRTARGQARAALNALKHGRYTWELAERPARAQCSEEAAHWQAIRSLATAGVGFLHSAAGVLAAEAIGGAAAGCGPSRAAHAPYGAQA